MERTARDIRVRLLLSIQGQIGGVCVCVIVVVGSDGCRIKTGINRGKGEDGVDIWEWHMQVWQDVYMSV